MSRCTCRAVRPLPPQVSHFGGFLLQTSVTPSSSCIARIKSVGPDATSLKGGQLVFVDFWNQSRDNTDDSILQGYMGGNTTLEKAWSSVPLEHTWTLNEELLTSKLGYSYVDLAYLGTVCVPLAGLLDIHVRPGDTVVVAPATGASGRFSTVQCTGDVDKDAASILAVCTNPKGADALIDFSPPQSAGSKHLVSCFSALRPHGKATLMGAVFSNVEVPYWLVMRNNIKIQGRYMFDRWHGEQAIKLIESGYLKLGSGENSGIRVHSFGLEGCRAGT
ncbi:hypothetical protein LTR24_009111 [Lithohypha guttulata]|uniref:Uncharacterized protein n=1 Tax=Lithohypha guttulata TaxID=1690604 RepID=A0ABR0JXZ3_9EURO|nr:hypothetical protein LTR24_009111 [Lithohypha guttulata]